MNTVYEVTFRALERVFTVSPVLVEFTLFGNAITIRWYGAIIAFGFALAVLFGGRMAYKWHMNVDKMLDVLIFGTIAGVLGARLYFVVFHFDLYQNNLGDIFRVWNGGLAIYGGLIGGIIAAYVVCRVRKLNFFNLLDIAAMSFLIGQGIGRWGNFMNQEAFGTNTNLPWGMRSNGTISYLLSHQAELLEKGMEVDPYGYVHPTFLYESIWCIVGFLLLYLITRKWRKFSGQIILSYGIWYGIGRTIFEGLRTDSLYLGGTTIRVSQLVSALLVIACSVTLILLLRYYHKHPKPIEGVDYFTDNFFTKKKAKAAAQDATVSEEVVGLDRTSHGEDEQP